MGHERAMFGMFWTHLQHQNTLTKHIEAFLAFFQKLVVKISHFSIKNDKETHVNQNRVCRFFCVCVCVVRARDNLRLKALVLENVLSTHIMGVTPLENFLRGREGQEANFFRLIVLKSKNF